MDDRTRIASPEPARQLDAATRRAGDAFLSRIRASHRPVAAVLFGSRARGTHAPDSDADVAVILKGASANRYALLGPLADAAFEVLLETGIYIQPLPLFETELEQPELYSNPALIVAIKRDGIRL